MGIGKANAGNAVYHIGRSGQIIHTQLLKVKAGGHTPTVPQFPACGIVIFIQRSCPIQVCRAMIILLGKKVLRLCFSPLQTALPTVLATTPGGN